jgi:glycosyltransferase involved in cell wall biosynthesis
MKNDIGIIGCFDYTNNHMIGAVVKTREISRVLQKNNYNVLAVDTYSWKSRLPLLVLEITKAFFTCTNIIIISALPSFCKINKLLSGLSKMTKKEYEFILIGGELQQQYVDNYADELKKVNQIIVESVYLKTELEKHDISNVSVMYNFKDLEPVSDSNFFIEPNSPLKFCTFSRVTKDKGISDAIYAIKKINELKNEIVACLDVYGEVSPEYKDEFYSILSDPSIQRFIKYKGIVKSEESVSCINKYFMLIFPTKFKGEGFPGTIIDSLNAGVPILASKWKYYNEILSEGYDSVAYDYESVESLVDRLLQIIDNPQEIVNLRENCLTKAAKYNVDEAIKVLTRNWNKRRK